jgi:hypothetical protein
VFGWLQADTVAAVWIAAAAIHREKNTVEAAAAAGLQPQQAAANKLKGFRAKQHHVLNHAYHRQGYAGPAYTRMIAIGYSGGTGARAWLHLEATRLTPLLVAGGFGCHLSLAGDSDRDRASANDTCHPKRSRGTNSSRSDQISFVHAKIHG